MCKMTLSWIIELVFFFSCLLHDVFPLKDVVLTIEPRVVQRYNHSTLQCSYDLEGDTLYSVKWYRGNHEFYRFSPGERPSTKVFAFKGITVDVNNSNATQVVLRDIEFNLSGNFSCEVTSDAPFFATGTHTGSMLVVQLPEYPPTISVGREPLDYGDTLRANCTSPPSRPKASLRFELNNMTVARTDPLLPSQYQETSWSDLSMELVLTEFYFSEGRLILRCIAEVDDIYHEEAILKLMSVRDPVPERVSAVDSTSASSTIASLQTVILCSILFWLS